MLTGGAWFIRSMAASASAGPSSVTRRAASQSGYDRRVASFGHTIAGDTATRRSTAFTKPRAPEPASPTVAHTAAWSGTRA